MMKRQLILIAFIAFLALSPIQWNNRVDARAISRERIHYEDGIRKNFRNFFNSILKKEVGKAETYRDILEQEAVKEQRAFITVKQEVKNELRRNALKQKTENNKIGVIDSNAAPFKREIHERTDESEVKSESPLAGEKNTDKTGEGDSVSGAKVDEKKETEKRDNDTVQNSNKKPQQQSDVKLYRTAHLGTEDEANHETSARKRDGYYPAYGTRNDMRSSYDRRDDLRSYDRDRARPYRENYKASYDRRDGFRSSYDRPSYSRRDGARSSYDRPDDRPPYDTRDGARSSYDRREDTKDRDARDGEYANKRADGANYEDREPIGRRDDEPARRREDPSDRPGDRYDRGDDDRYDGRGDRYNRRDDRYDRRDERYDGRSDRYDRRDDRYDRRGDDRYDRRDDRYERRGDDRYDRRDDRYERRGDDRYERRDDRSETYDSGRSYQGKDDGPHKKMTFEERFGKDGKHEESKPRYEETQSSSRYSDRRNIQDERGDLKGERPNRGETKRPFVNRRGPVSAHDLFMHATRESVSLLREQEKFTEVLRQSIINIFNQTNANGTAAEPLDLLDKIKQGIQDKMKVLVQQSTKDVTIDEMIPSLDQKYFTSLSSQWLEVKNYLLEHNPRSENELYASTLKEVEKANNNLTLDYRIVKNIIQRIEATKD